METDNLIQYGHAVKPFEDLTANELAEANDRLGKKIRKRAWEAGSPVYYGQKDFIIAEYENGRKMVVKEVNGQLVEIGEYNG